MKSKVVALLSGGLDSMLAVRVILDQGVPVTALRFLTHFGCDADGTGSCGKDVSPIAKSWGPLGLEIKYCHLGDAYVQMVKNPRFGRGKNMNSLSPLGKLILIVSMYVGRLGPLTLAFALSSPVETTRYKYPNTHIMVG